LPTGPSWQRVKGEKGRASPVERELGPLLGHALGRGGGIGVLGCGWEAWAKSGGSGDWAELPAGPPGREQVTPLFFPFFFSNLFSKAFSK